jgi:hypothetical protein
MSQKGSKGGAPSRKEEAEKGPLGKKGMPDDLAEIGIDSFKNIDAIDIKLNNYLREHTQDLESIIQDQMMLSQITGEGEITGEGQGRKGKNSQREGQEGWHRQNQRQDKI